MKLTIDWLKEYVDFDLGAEELAELLALSGTEVEAIVSVGSGLEKVIVGEIKKIEPHPNADRLSYCEVALPDGVAHIVCGATNIAIGQKVPVAVPGAKLPGGIEIKKTKLRGLLSEGMMCSEIELGISDEATGILILPPETSIGAPVAKILGLQDTVLELEITPNRPDCMSVIGMARELAALTGATLKYPAIEPGNIDSKAPGGIKVRIDDPDLCDRYTARLAKGVKITAGPAWMTRRLEACGIRSINNVVDVTNYVMLEMGQPLHAFDYSLLKGQEIIVRRARAGEKLITIDHVTRELDPEMLVIADAKHPVALAGVMGGFDTEISEKTRDVLIESAAFEPANIRKTSRSLGLISESSLRFEKGIDVESTGLAADRAAQLLASTGSADISAATVEDYPRPWSRPTITVRTSRVGAVLGSDISSKSVVGFLKSLELDVDDDKKNLRVTPPGFRRDLEREIDLIEEVARMHGLNNIPSRLPVAVQSTRGYSPDQLLRQQTIRILLAAGLDEAISYSFVSRASIENLGLESNDAWLRMVDVVNPLSEEQAVMRTSLWPGLLNAAAANLNKGNENLSLFEQGNVFLGRENDHPEQAFVIGLLLSGNTGDPHWLAPKRRLDFYDMKGIFEAVAKDLRLSDRHFRPALHSSLRPGVTAEMVVGDSVVGIFGQLHPRVQETYGIKQDVFIGELEVDALSPYVQDAYFAEIPRFPGMQLDLALVVDEHVASEQVLAVLRESGGKLLQEARIFDVYRGEGIEDGKKSLAFSLMFQSQKRTLTDDEVARIVGKMTGAAFKQLEATVRA